MSASAVLNLIAPSAPLPVQAVGDADASAFGGLLSDALSGDATVEDTPAPRPTTQPLRDTTKAATKLVALDDTTPGTLVDPTGLGLIQTLVPVPVVENPDVALTDADAAGTDQTTKTADQAQVSPLPVVQPAGLQTSAVQTSTSKTTAPSTLSVLPVVKVAEAVIDDAQTLPSATLMKVAEASTTPVSQVQPPAPAPLKPASERTGRSSDSLTREGGDAVSLDGSKASATASSASTTTGAPTTGKASSDVFPALSSGAPQTADADLSGDPKSDGAAAILDTVAAQTEAAVTHDAGLSTLSRATIDATAQIAAQILRKLDGRSTRFEMALTPDELGRVDVKLEIDAEGRLAARLAFDNPAAAADLRGRADELRRQLQDAGFHVPDDAFEFTERDSGSSAFDRGSSDQNNSERQNRAFTAASRLNAEIDLAQPPRWMSLSLSPSGVDLKV